VKRRAGSRGASRDLELEAGTRAHFEDADYYTQTYADRTDDVAFYVEAGVRAGGPVLEYGVGNGRIAIPLARRGVEVVGVDLSPPMLRDLRARLAREPAGRDRVDRRGELGLGLGAVHRGVGGGIEHDRGPHLAHHARDRVRRREVHRGAVDADDFAAAGERRDEVVADLSVRAGDEDARAHASPPESARRTLIRTRAGRRAGRSFARLRTDAPAVHSYTFASASRTPTWSFADSVGVAPASG